MFDQVSEEWIDFVSVNRNGVTTDYNFDLVIGPVADDDVYRSFQLYMTGLLSVEQTIEALRIKKLFNQYVFKSDKSLTYLHFVKAIEV